MDKRARRTTSVKTKIYSASIIGKRKCVACKSDSTFFTKK